MNLLLICHANVCRSRIAESVFRCLFPESKGVSIQSAGLAAASGVAIHPIAHKVLSRRGYTVPSEPSSARLTMPMLQWADLVLVMETVQRKELVRRYPFTAGKVWLLGHWIGQEVTDPVGGDEQMFDATLTLIESGARGWQPALAMQTAL
ncbi:low molecular weight phosphotyrosine protein phosphatase [Paraburkholderia hospita]|uniref:arsenate reductase/protein-tyrosine-phosphatase family protein n=1 Tax=Paraburkholderia hospita TaxID=169430 RepID=UPI001374BCA8|nr:low molecular weight phosphotyrosine protein phosphatase [Paraburkholderia hospita]